MEVEVVRSYSYSNGTEKSLACDVLIINILVGLLQFYWLQKSNKVLYLLSSADNVHELIKLSLFAWLKPIQIIWILAHTVAHEREKNVWKVYNSWIEIGFKVKHDSSVLSSLKWVKVASIPKFRKKKTNYHMLKIVYLFQINKSRKR